MSLHPRIGNVWANDIGDFGDVTYTETFLHGCETAQWSMRPGTRHSALVSNAPVTIYEGPLPVWHGLVDQVGRDGTVTAYGAHTVGQGVLALDSGGLPTSNPNVAVAAAIARGAVPWKGSHDWLAAVGEAEPGLTLSALLDRTAETYGYYWGVNHLGMIEGRYAATQPSWATAQADDLWTMSNDDYVTHLNVYYTSGVDTYVSYIYTTATASAASERWGRSEAYLDLRNHGIITLETANSLADAALAKTGPRMVLADSLTLAPGQLRTVGDQVAGWAGVHAGQGVRLWGVPDRSRVQLSLHTDFTVGQLQRTASSLVLTPLGAPPSNVRDVIADIVGEANTAA